MLDRLPPELPHFTPDIDDVIRSEEEYIRERRAFHQEVRAEDNPKQLSDIWGLALSGGGIRSATLALGIMQKLIVADVFKKFDYLSSVSGGGYMAACFSSLMNHDSESFYIPPEFESPEKQAQIPGLQYNTSPFVNLIEMREVEEEKPVPDLSTEEPKEVKTRYVQSMRPDSLRKKPSHKQSPEQRKEIVLNYKDSAETRIDVRHQIHHLRTHGEYLTPDKSFLSVDVQKALGTVLGGIFHNFFLFFLALTALVSLHLLFFDLISGGEMINTLSGQMTTLMTDLTQNQGMTPDAAREQISFWQNGFIDYISLVINSLIKHLPYSVGIMSLGFVVSMLFIRFSGVSAQRFRRWDDKTNRKEIEEKIPAGHDYEDFFEQRFLRRVNTINILGGLLVGFGLLFYGLQWGSMPQEDYWIVFGLPVCYSLGIFLGIYFGLAFVSQRPWQLRYSRSLHGALRGGAFYGLLVSALTPILLILLFSLSLFWKVDDGGAQTNSNTLISTISSLVSVVAGYLTLNQSDSEGSGWTTRMLYKLKLPLLSLSVILFVGLATYSIIRILTIDAGGNFNLPLWALIISTGLFILMGFLVDSNRLSLHYFYRDRLSESFLRTDGRVKRSKPFRQGMPLVNLRNDENMRLKDLGWSLKGDKTKSNPRAPYHLIVTALNLQGTDELVRKDLKSDHFIFSRNYIGANSTGYVRTDYYRGGKTKLARAMTISAAAVGSGMGFSSFFAQSFITTLLNLRLGYWMENPWYYRNIIEESVRSPLALKWKKLLGWREIYGKEEDFTEGGEVCLRYTPERKFTFWPGYLLKEMLGLTSGNTRLVNLSDGGHTGDNCGILPLAPPSLQTDRGL